MKKMIITLSLVALLSCNAIAQDAEKKEEEKTSSVNSEYVKAKIKTYLTKDFSLVDIPEIRKKVILDFPKALATLSTANNSLKITLSNPSSIHAPVIAFSTTIPDPYAGSPAYDIIPGPRFSMNVDRVSGKYYWEW